MEGYLLLPENEQSLKVFIFVGYSTVLSRLEANLHLSTSPGLKSKSREEQAVSKLHAYLLFNPRDGGDMFLSTDCRVPNRTLNSCLLNMPLCI
jgi:hypothetical protein